MPDISGVLLSVEARQFWERVYVAVLEHPERFVENGAVHPAGVADEALKDWQNRFAKPEGGDA